MRLRDIVLVGLNRAAQAIKGREYSLDPNLPVSALIGFALRRIFSVMRAAVTLRRAPFGRGKIAFFGRRVVLRNRKYILINGGVTLGDSVLIDGLSSGGVEIGSRVSIGPYSIIEATGVISALGKGFSIGPDSGIGAFSFVGAAGGVKVGANVIMGQRVSFHSENHVFDRLDIPIREQGVTRIGIEVGDDCWIGANVVFLDGARVGRGCVIGAGSVVRGIIPDYSIAVGVPARVLRVRA